MSECPDDACNLANGKHNKLICPKFVQSKPTSVQQVSASQYIVNEDNVVVGLNPEYVAPLSENVVNIEGKSVALPTAVYTATNENALKLPLDQRNIAILADSAAQRTLVTKETTQKLGLDTIGTERACLIGYGNKKSQNN